MRADRAGHARFPSTVLPVAWTYLVSRRPRKQEPIRWVIARRLTSDGSNRAGVLRPDGSDPLQGGAVPGATSARLRSPYAPFLHRFPVLPQCRDVASLASNASPSSRVDRRAF